MADGRSTAEVLAKAAALNDDELNGLSEEELARLMLTLRQPRQLQESAQSLARLDNATVPSVGTEVSDADTSRWPAMALCAITTLCVAALVTLVLQAGDPCERRLIHGHNAIQQQLEGVVLERDQLFSQLQRVLAERDALRDGASSTVISGASRGGGLNDVTEIGVPPALRSSYVETPPFGQRLRVGHIVGGHADLDTTSTVWPSPSSAADANAFRGINSLDTPNILEVDQACSVSCGYSRERMYDELRIQLQSRTRDNDRLQAAFQAQSEELWHLQAGRSDDLHAESLQRSLMVCKSDLQQAWQVQDQVRRLVGRSGA